jgi:hypothetical protein
VGRQGGYSRGDIQDFARQSGLHPALYNYFISWNGSDSALHWLSFGSRTRRRRTRP